LAYWLLRGSEDLMGARPLGITILGVENYIAGVTVAIAGILLLFLPIFGIIGVIVIAIGVAIIYLGKGLWNGAEWAVGIQTILTIIGIIAGFVGLAFHSGNPTLAIFQVWYLRRPYVREFFQRLDSTTVWSGLPSKSGLPSEQTCMACGARTPTVNPYCSNCGIRIFSSSEGFPFGGAFEDERIVSLKLERVQAELQKLNRLKQEGKIVDPNLFERAYSERASEHERLKAKLKTITARTLAL